MKTGSAWNCCCGERNSGLFDDCPTCGELAAHGRRVYRYGASAAPRPAPTPPPAARPRGEGIRTRYDWSCLCGTRNGAGTRFCPVCGETAARGKAIYPAELQLAGPGRPARKAPPARLHGSTRPTLLLALLFLVAWLGIWFLGSSGARPAPGGARSGYLENAGSVRHAMTPEQVRAIRGAPERVAARAEGRSGAEAWYYDGRRSMLVFADGRLAGIRLSPFPFDRLAGRLFAGG